jgi:hypothetical protein
MQRASEDNSTLTFRPLDLQVRFTCVQAQVGLDQTLPCEVYLLASPKAGPALIPRLLPPFRIRAWPDLSLQIEARNEHGIVSRLEIAPGANRGRYDIVLPLSEESLLILQPGQLYGWCFDLNGEDWLLPHEPGQYRLRAMVTLHMRERDSKGNVDPAVRAKLGKHPELLNLVVPDGIWYSNEVLITLTHIGKP